MVTSLWNDVFVLDVVAPNVEAPDLRLDERESLDRRLDESS